MKTKQTTRPGCLIVHSAEETHLLREVMRIHQSILNVFSREVGIPASKLSLLRLLAISHPEEPGILEIARQLSIDAAAVTRQVKELEGQKLVIRRSDPGDKRRICLRLTAKGKKAFGILHEKAHQFEKRLESRMEKEEMAIALKVLSTLRVALENLK